MESKVSQSITQGALSRLNSQRCRRNTDGYGLGPHTPLKSSFSILTRWSAVLGVASVSKFKTELCLLFCRPLFICMSVGLAGFYSNAYGTNCYILWGETLFKNRKIIQPAEKLGSDVSVSVHFLVFVTKQHLHCFHSFSREQTGGTDCCFWDWLNTDFIPRKDSADMLHRNTDTLHSRDVRQRWDASIAVREKCPDKFLVEWQTPWGKDKALQIRSFLFKTNTGEHTVYERNFEEV